MDNNHPAKILIGQLPGQIGKAGSATGKLDCPFHDPPGAADAESLKKRLIKIAPYLENGQTGLSDIEIEYYKTARLIDFALKNPEHTIEEALEASFLLYAEFERVRKILFQPLPDGEPAPLLGHRYTWLLKPEIMIRYAAYFEHRKHLRSSSKAFFPAFIFFLLVALFALLFFFFSGDYRP